MEKLLLVLFLILTIILPCTSQTVTTNKDLQFSVDNQRYQISNDSIKKIYDREIVDENAYINGKSYVTYYNPSRSKPLLNIGYTQGTIYSKGKEFKNLTLAYDRNLDEIIAAPNNKLISNQIYVQKSNIDSVCLFFQNETFHLTKVQIDQDTIDLKSGFYEIFKYQDYQLYVKYSIYINNEGGYDIYQPMIIRYLHLNNTFHTIKKKKQLLALFPEKKKLIRKKITSLQSSYNKFNNGQLGVVLNYISSL